MADNLQKIEKELEKIKGKILKVYDQDLKKIKKIAGNKADAFAKEVEKNKDYVKSCQNPTGVLFNLRATMDGKIFSNIGRDAGLDKGKLDEYLKSADRLSKFENLKKALEKIEKEYDELKKETSKKAEKIINEATKEINEATGTNVNTPKTIYEAEKVVDKVMNKVKEENPTEAEKIEKNIEKLEKQAKETEPTIKDELKKDMNNDAEVIKVQTQINDKSLMKKLKGYIKEKKETLKKIGRYAYIATGIIAYITLYKIVKKAGKNVNFFNVLQVVYEGFKVGKNANKLSSKLFVLFLVIYVCAFIVVGGIMLFNVLKNIVNKFLKK